MPVLVTGDTGSDIPLLAGHEDEPVLEPIRYLGGLVDASLLTGMTIMQLGIYGMERDPKRFYNYDRKIAGLAQPDEPWFQDVLAASGLRDLCQVGYTKIHNGMLMAIAERWRLETSSFHLPHGEITITLDDVACLLHLPIRGTLIGHGRLTNEEAMEMPIAELGCKPDDALEEAERTRGAQVRFHTWLRLYDAELLAAHQAVGDEVEADIHKERALRCYFLYLIDTQLFMDMSSSYTDVVYLMYLSDTTHIHEYNWGATVLAYGYYRLGEGCLWKAWILQHFPDIIGWGEVPTYIELMPRASRFNPRRGNREPLPYRRELGRIAAEDIRSDCYVEHRETVSFDEITLYSGWLDTTLTIIVRQLLERVTHGLFSEGSAERRVVDTMIKLAQEVFLYRRNRARTGRALDARGRARSGRGGRGGGGRGGEQQDDVRHTQ
ncbi:uncharacterized protein LOC131657662 [Vicia villosa]|uniref:uncharacterized protein LOC131657662 n=1 Tax=Vicia villosa TaxID=3911 RepID=UPI00273A777B|nr:uncharacterized protein LOC131657662 [Vicia villosa]